MNSKIPLPIQLETSKNMTFVEWLKKKPDNSKWNHFNITEEWGMILYNLLNSQENLYVKVSDKIFIKKFQYFLYKRSSKNENNYIYYYK